MRAGPTSGMISPQWHWPRVLKGQYPTAPFSSGGLSGSLIAYELFFRKGFANHAAYQARSAFVVDIQVLSMIPFSHLGTARGQMLKYLLRCKDKSFQKP